MIQKSIDIYLFQSGAIQFAGLFLLHVLFTGCKRGHTLDSGKTQSGAERPTCWDEHWATQPVA